MSSHWVAVKPNHSTSSNKELMDKINKKIDEQIECYELNVNGAEDDYIKANLKLIKDLAQNIKNSDDIRSIEKIISTFCEIMDIQRETIHDLSVVYTQPVGSNQYQHNYVSSYVAPVDGFTNDEQIKSVFINFMVNGTKKKRSSFTANDYILRVQNLWRSFYSDYEAGELPSELAESVIKDEIQQDSPLLNAYNYIEELNCYLSMKIAGDSSRNWLNVRAALNIFGEAMHGEEYEKVKIPREATQSKDFSKYLFEGKTYGKSRLVLAVVQKYVEDHQTATFDELETAFPSSIQGSLGVVRRIEEVSDKYKGIGGVKRYFIKEDEIIRLSSGEQVIVCTQWGINNTELLIKHVLEYGYNIKQI